MLLRLNDFTVHLSRPILGSSLERKEKVHKGERQVYLNLGYSENTRSCSALLWSRVRPRFFDQVGHQTTNASIGIKYFFTK